MYGIFTYITYIMLIFMVNVPVPWIRVWLPLVDFKYSPTSSTTQVWNLLQFPGGAHVRQSLIVQGGAISSKGVASGTGRQSCLGCGKTFSRSVRSVWMIMMILLMATRNPAIQLRLLVPNWFYTSQLVGTGISEPSTVAPSIIDQLPKIKTQDPAINIHMVFLIEQSTYCRGFDENSS